MSDLRIRRWNHIDDPTLKFMVGMSESIQRIEMKYPGILPNLRDGDTIVVGSDYGGEHGTSQYDTLAFVFANLEDINEWDKQRMAFRNEYLTDGRRMSFKNLNDSQRQEALIPFLHVASNLPGLLYLVLINKEIDSMFRKEGSIDMDYSDLSQYSHWKGHVFEKLLRIVHNISLITAGLSRKGQNLYWFSDQDAIMPNEKRFKEVVEIFSTVCSNYLTHDLGHFRAGTTKSDTGRRDIEDFVSITDLAAGSLCNLLTAMDEAGIKPSSSIRTLSPSGLPDKVRVIRNWFADDNMPLRKLLYVIDPEEGSTRLLQTCLKFETISGAL